MENEDINDRGVQHFREKFENERLRNQHLIEKLKRLKKEFGCELSFDVSGIEYQKQKNYHDISQKKCSNIPKSKFVSTTFRKVETCKDP